MSLQSIAQAFQRYCASLCRSLVDEITGDVRSIRNVDDIVDVETR